jgi:hypothetical protein
MKSKVSTELKTAVVKKTAEENIGRFSLSEFVDRNINDIIFIIYKNNELLYWLDWDIKINLSP